MKASLDHRASPSKEDLASLFQKGRIGIDCLDAPPYATQDGNECVLKPITLQDPAVFIRALQDYVRSCALPLWDHERTIGDTEEQRAANLRDCTIVLRRELHKPGDAMTEREVSQRLNGRQAEYVTATWIRTMLRCFPGNTSLLEWSHDDVGIDLGAGYSLRPFPPTNIELQEGDPRSAKSLGELDMVVCAEDNVLHFIDVSTNPYNIFRKLARGRSPEEHFIAFRNRIRNLFHEDVGRGGIKDVTKIHIFCGNNMNIATPCSEGDGDGTVVFACELPSFSIIRIITSHALHALRDAGILLKNVNGDFRLRRGCGKMGGSAHS